MTDTSARTRTLRAVVADDDVFTASMVASALRSTGIETAQATSAADAWEIIAKVEPNAVVTDLDFGGGDSGAELLWRVHREQPWVGLVVLTSHLSPQLAVGDGTLPPSVVYLVKSQVKDVDVLVAAVDAAIVGGDHQPAEPDDDVRTVTRAQAEVLRLVASGASTRRIAAERGTSVRAVETMLGRLYTALGVDADEQANPRVTAARLWQQGRVRIR
ncbi:response regulator [Leifsonia sp. 21MFCrub1.1]|uniref:response regulator n=1 Tax=Leifsonia sp. 21MFCrub1.1 TaxID=1798223 RepID=UPI000892A307|nr:response regulator [Leifsonia sp. 21MFCrub1.1]SEA31734.1 DNA-binding response regulator, NarL/FixJ family, contains REC and HTH domains [Leifsonia sp. 21MFCrub1.1]